MAIPKLVPFQAEHMLYLTMHRAPVDPLQSMSIEIDGKIEGCFGLQLMIPGSAVIWAYFSPEVKKHPIWLTRSVRRMMRDVIVALQLERIETIVRVDDPRARLWLQSLGFTRECGGIARRYTPERTDVVRYEFIVGAK